MIMIIFVVAFLLIFLSPFIIVMMIVIGITDIFFGALVIVVNDDFDVGHCSLAMTR